MNFDKHSRIVSGAISAIQAAGLPLGGNGSVQCGPNGVSVTLAPGATATQVAQAQQLANMVFTQETTATPNDDQRADAKALLSDPGAIGKAIRAVAMAVLKNPPPKTIQDVITQAEAVLDAGGID